MQNKIIYSCDTSDEGSDMDVSDIEETPHVEPPPTRPHEAMVNNLSHHIQRETIATPRIVPHTTHVTKHIPAPPNPTSYASIASRPMVTSLHTYGKTSSWGPNAIRPTEEKGQKNLRNNLCGTLRGKLRGKLSINPDEDEGDSDDSFHTAPSSPRFYESDSEPASLYQAPAYQAPVYQAPTYQTPVHQAPAYQAPVYQAPVYQAPVHQAPVHQPPVYQAPAPPTPKVHYESPKKVNKPAPEPKPEPEPPTDMLNRMEQIEKQLTANEDLAKNIRERLKNVSNEREQLRINRLKNQVHNSLARNRKSNVIQKGQATLVLDKNRIPSIAKSDDKGKASAEPRVENKGKAPAEPRIVDKGKAPAEPRIVDKGKAPAEPRVVDKGKAPAEPKIVDKGKGAAEPRRVDKGKAPDVTPMDMRSDGSVHDDSMGEDSDDSFSSDDDDESDPDFAPPIHPVGPSRVRVFPRNLKKKTKAEIRARQGSLEQAIIDKPLSRKYINRGLVKDSSRALIEDRKAKEHVEKLVRIYEASVSERDRKMIKPDAQRYKGRHRDKIINVNNVKYRRVARNYIENRPLSLKEIRLLILNMKDTSIKKGTLSYQQEEFLKELVRRLIAINHTIFCIDEDHYNFALVDRTPVHVNKSLTIGKEYFGDLQELDLNANDVPNYEVYKAIRHFSELNSHMNMRKACQQLLETDLPYLKALRRPDPSDPNGDIAQDPDLPIRLMRLNNEIKEHTKIRRRMLKRDAKLLQAANANKQKQQGKLKIAPPKQVKEIKMEHPQSPLIPQGESSSPTLSRRKRKRQRKAIRESEIENTTTRYRDLDAENDTLEREIDRMAYEITANLRDKKRKVEKLVPTEEDFETRNDKCDISLYLQAKGHPSKGARVKVGPIPNPPVDTPINIFNSSQPAASFNEPVATPPEPNHATPPPPEPNHTTLPPPAPVASSSHAGSSTSYRPYQSALSSLGLSNGSSSQAPSTSALCSAESAGGVCNVKNCPATHFKDFF